MAGDFPNQGFSSLQPADILLKNCTICDKNGKREGDILIQKGKIVEVGKGLRASCKTVDVKGLYVFPGCIDIHVHMREPGEEHKETIFTASLACAHGGVTSAFAMPNTSPPVDDDTKVAFVRERAKRTALIRVFPTGCATRGREGKQISPYGLMKKEGALAVTDDGSFVENTAVALNAILYAKTFGLVFMEHPEIKDISGKVNEGEIFERCWITPYPAVAEVLAVERDIALAKYLSAHVHLTHISTAESVEAVKRAKEEGVKITVDVTPHHLLLSENEIDITNSSFRVNPPLRGKEDVERLWEALADGFIDAIASDHAPHSEVEKLCDFPSSAPGISSADFFLPLVWQLVEKGVITPEKMTELVSFNPAQIFKLKGFGLLDVGYEGDLVVFHPDEETLVNPQNIFSKGKNCPWIGKKLKGKVKMTVVLGNVVWSDGEFAEPHQAFLR